jgi:protein TonB
VTPAEEEIPVEIVQEQPPPPPSPPPAPEPSPEPKSQPQEIEKPAVDAPRAGKSDHDDETVAEKPKPAEAPPPPAETPPPTPEPSAPPPAPEPEAPKAAEAELPEPVKAEPTNTPAPTPTLAKPIAEALAKAMAPPPDVDFGGEAINSPVTGGNAKSTYLTKLYGLIVPQLHVPAIAHAFGRKLTGSVSFSVDGRGRLRQRYVSEGSGSMELDEAAMQAVAAAARSFPAPPHGAPVGMTFTYTVN